MPDQHLDFSALPQISKMDLSYACHWADLADFYQYAPTLENFGRVAADKEKDGVDRALLAEVLLDQYRTNSLSNPDDDARIQALLEPNCFTITTAHQPSLLTGPLYFIYKAFSAIVLARSVQKRHPKLTVQAIFIIGGEDHDFAEINHLRFGNRKISWDHEAGGSVSRMSTTGLEAVLTALDEVPMAHSDAVNFRKHLHRCLQKSESYGQFTTRAVHFLLGQYGILILNMDDPRLKKAMISKFSEELFANPSQPLVQDTQEKLIRSGYKSQAYPREINLFYLTDSLRERIERSGDSFHVLNSNISFTKEEMIAELENHPERFSPNVVFRPIYQESILPNLAYVGGGGELAYWLERKSQFEHFGINFPMLVRRDSAVWVDKWAQRKIQKLNLQLTDLAAREETIVNKAVTNWSSADFSIDDELLGIEQVFEGLHAKANAIDPSLGPMIRAQRAYHLKRLKHLGGKLRKMEKSKHQKSVDTLIQLREKLFPNGRLQERSENFLSIFGSEGLAFFEILLEKFDPLNPRVKVLYAP